MTLTTYESPRRDPPPGRIWKGAALLGLGLALRARGARPQADEAAAPPRLRSAATDQATGAAERGREAVSPREIPKRGWKDILIRTGKEFGEDQIALVSAGVTFYVLLALFPALAAVVSIYGLFADPSEVPGHLERLAVVMPEAALGFVNEQLARIAAAQEGGLSAGAALGLLLSLWSANRAMKAVFSGLNVAYDEAEHRGFVAKTAITLTFTVGFILFAILAIAVIAAAPALSGVVGGTVATIVNLLAWPLLVLTLFVGLTLLYRYGPNRDRAKWRWVTWGSGVAVVLWIAFSALFSLYLGSFANFNETYGSLGAVIGFLMWIYFSSQVILLGAELDSEIEHQTLRDTTVGRTEPFGRRGAVMADTVGEPQGR